MVDLFDTTALIDGSARRTRDGYLVADVKVARVGVQNYKGSEVGRTDKDVVAIYRPPQEVFGDAAMASFAHRPITINHPRDAVSSVNWKNLAVGNVGDEVKRDGDFVRVPLILMDEGAIKAVEGGKRQLSMGYSAEIVWGDGVTPEGERFDGYQKDIRANHLAIVDLARGGPALAIDNGPQEEHAMNDSVRLQAVVVDGVSVQMTDVAASVVNRAITAMQGVIDKFKVKAEEDEKALKAAKDAHSAEVTTLKADHTKAIEAKDAEIVTLKKAVEDSKFTPAQVDALVKDRTDAIAKARTIVGDKLVIDGKTTPEIKRQAVEAKLGDAAKGWTDEQVAVSFTTMTAGVAGTDPIRDAARGGLARTGPAAGGVDRTEANKALTDHASWLTNAWKGKEAA